MAKAIPAPVVFGGLSLILAREKGDSHLLPVAAGDTAPAKGRGLQTKGGCHLFRNGQAAGRLG